MKNARYSSTVLLVFCVLSSGCDADTTRDNSSFHAQEKPYPELDKIDYQRSFYKTEEECARNWRKEDCEKVTGNSEGRGGHAWFYGPYFSRSGTVYGYDGQIYKRDPAMLPSTRSGNTVKSSGSIENMMATPGKYASTPKSNLSPIGKAIAARSAHTSAVAAARTNSISAGSRATSVSGRGSVGGAHGGGSGGG